MKASLFSILAIFLVLSCAKQEKEVVYTGITPGAWQTTELLPMLEGKSIAMVVNHTSTIQDTHLVDSLVSLGIDIKVIFSPEHGFRGDEDAGKKIQSGIDQETGIQIVSLYGAQRKPTPENLENIDIVVFDIQDVGTRFYTYITTMHFAMEACAENNLPFIVLDRPNPTGDYVAGPVREDDQVSFVGMHPIPIVHGLTVGELDQMINGENWLENGVQCDLKVIKLKNYTHNDLYEVPLPPSPNLPTARSVRLYPSLCLFEGTSMSIGRGTEYPFQVIGYPDSTFGEFSFTPISRPGFATYPKHQDKVCYGVDLREGNDTDKFTLKLVMEYFNKTGPDSSFFARPGAFDRLAGTSKLREQMMEGLTIEEIEATWQEDLDQYKAIRKKYLLYPDYE